MVLCINKQIYIHQNLRQPPARMPIYKNWSGEIRDHKQVLNYAQIRYKQKK